MRKTIRGYPRTLLLLLAVLCLVACGASKVATASKSETTTEAMQLSQNAAHQDEVARADQQSIMMQDQMELTITKQSFTSPIPEQTSSLEIPTQSLLDLPEGSSYSASNGRSSVEAQKRGDNILLKGKCDALAREVTNYEKTVFRQHSVIDSLRNEILAQKNRIAQYEFEAEARSDVTSTEQFTQTKPAHKGRWLLSGILLGVLLTVATNLVWVRTPIKDIIQSLTNKIKQLWQK